MAWKEVCQISDECFTVPGGYRKLNQLGGRGMIDEEEELLQLAIRQSLLEQSGGGGNVSVCVCQFSPVNLVPFMFVTNTRKSCGQIISVPPKTR